MKRILASTALAMIMAGGHAFAADNAATNNAATNAAGNVSTYQSQPDDIRTSEFVGQRVYATENIPAETVQAGAEREWDDIGEINEVLLGRDGSVKAVVLGVGGFLGMGEKNVALPMTDVKFVRNGEGPNDYFLVVNTTKQALTDAPAWAPAEQTAQANQDPGTENAAATTPDASDTAANATGVAPADNAANTTGTTTTPMDNAANNATGTTTTPMDDTANNTTTTMPGSTTATSDTAATTNQPAATDTQTTASTTRDPATATTMNDNRTRLTRPEVTREGYRMAEANELTADKLTGATVYGPKDENVGTINRLILNDQGQISQVVLDVGGFLGMGERQIAVTLDELNIVRNQNGEDVRVYIDANQATLKAQPEFKG